MAHSYVQRYLPTPLATIFPRRLKYPVFPKRWMIWTSYNAYATPSNILTQMVNARRRRFRCGDNNVMCISANN